MKKQIRVQPIGNNNIHSRINYKLPAPQTHHKHAYERKMRPPRTAEASNLGEAEISRGMVRLDSANHHGGGGGWPGCVSARGSRGGF